MTEPRMTPDTPEARLRAVLEKWIDPSHLQTFNDRERFRAEAEAVLSSLASARSSETDQIGLLRAMVDKQAEDESLWFVTQTAPESHLQAALRLLHEAIERSPLSNAEILRMNFELECRDVDELLLALGGIPRSEGGRINLPRVLAKIEQLSSLASAPAEAMQDGEVCICGHERDWHGNDGVGSCGATKSCRAGACKAFQPASAPSPEPAPPAEPPRQEKTL